MGLVVGWKCHFAAAKNAVNVVSVIHSTSGMHAIRSQQRENQAILEFVRHSICGRALGINGENVVLQLHGPQME